MIFISAHADVPMSVRAMKAGAVEFLTKPVHHQHLLDAVQSAIALDRTQRATQGDLSDARIRFLSLTARERQVAALVTSGNLNKQIAGKLGLS